MFSFKKFHIKCILISWSGFYFIYHFKMELFQLYLIINNYHQLKLKKNILSEIFVAG